MRDLVVSMVHERSYTVRLHLEEADPGFVLVRLDVQGIPLGPARFVPDGEHDFERLLGLLVSLVGPTSPDHDGPPIEVALEVETEHADAHSLSVCLQGRDLGSSRMTADDLAGFERFVEQSILLVSARSFDVAGA